jgi:acyl carrier protein
MQAIERDIRAFLVEHILPEEDVRNLRAEDDLLEGGVLNSLTLLHLIEHVETTYDMQVTLQEFRAEHFRTIERICRFVESKQSLEPERGASAP